MRNIAILCLCVMLMPVSPVEAKFRALLVGINYTASPKSKERLRGAINDVTAMRELMIKQLGIPADAIMLLTEEQATREQILQTFQNWLIDGTQTGDTVFFQYSGHGGQQEISETFRTQLEEKFGLTVNDPVKPSSERRTFIEFLVPYDTLVYADEQEAAMPILDLELHQLLSALAGRKTHVFLDSCFSAGATRKIVETEIQTRQVELPWDLSHYVNPFQLTGLPPVRSAPRLLRKSNEEWEFDYTLFAAVKYFQAAKDLSDHGAFTLPVLEWLRSHPGQTFTNNDILREARTFIHHTLGISAADQEPVFYGPASAFDEPFVLTVQVSPPSEQTPISAIESEYETIINVLAGIEHPNPPLSVDLWLDKPGKTQFTTQDRVTLYYRVNGLEAGRKAYLTLLNVAPDGTVAILYPQKHDITSGIGTPVYFNDEVTPGMVYSIPKGQDALQSGQNVAIDLRLRLAKGDEYFKAIVTSEQINWEQMQLDEFQATFHGAAARGLAEVVSDLTPRSIAWGTGSLRVTVQDK